MNAIDKFAPLLALTRAPFPASTKSAIVGSRADLRVPVRDVALTNGEVVSLYDTSGPYTDPDAVIDVRKGLAGVRNEWIAARGDVEHYEGRAPVALDDGQKSEDATRLAQLRAEAAGPAAAEPAPKDKQKPKKKAKSRDRDGTRSEAEDTGTTTLAIIAAQEAAEEAAARDRAGEGTPGGSHAAPRCEGPDA